MDHVKAKLAEIASRRNGRQIISRLTWIEGRAMAVGAINRNDIARRFDISLPKATVDIAMYADLNPGALTYSTQMRSHVWNGTPIMKNALSSYLEGNDDLPLSEVPVPTRRFIANVVQQLISAKVAMQPLAIEYMSLSSGSGKVYRICPHGIVNTSKRYHVRAYSADHDEYRDFVLGRIGSIMECADGTEWRGPEGDRLWREKTAFILSPHPKLTPEQAAVVSREYGMVGNRLHYRCRKAMAIYVAEELNLLQAIKNGSGDPGVENWIICENPAEIRDAIGFKGEQDAEKRA